MPGKVSNKHRVKKRALNSSKYMKMIKAAYAPRVRANPEMHVADNLRVGI